jgi:hypothetical protein
MKRKPWELSRRTFLGGAAASVALPLLEAMAPSLARSARAAEGATPKRMLFYYAPCGIHMASWTPQRTGAGYDLPLILEPLEGIQDKVTVVTGLANLPARPDGPGDHAAGTGSFLTATHVHKTEGADIENGVSVDQAAAAALGSATRFASLQLGAEGGGSVGGCDSGYSCAYARNISWSGPATPLPKMVSPQLTFDRLFGGRDEAASAAEAARRRELRASVLDYVRRDTASLQNRLGASDRAKVDEYLTGVRELERQIQAAEGQAACTPPAMPEDELSLDVTTHIRLMSDLMVTAFRCDLTRIQSFMLANAGTNRYYDFLGVEGGHHDLSHHQNLESNFRQLEVIDRWEMVQLRYLLDGLDAIEEGEGTLLDNTMVFFSSEIEDGNSHRHENLPVLLAGGAGGSFVTGQHVRVREGRPIASLFLTMLDRFGVTQETFGDDSDGIIEELLG